MRGAEIKISAGVQRVTCSAELTEMVQYILTQLLSMNKHEVGEILSQKSESERRLSDNRSHDMTLGQLVNSRNLIL